MLSQSTTATYHCLSHGGERGIDFEASLLALLCRVARFSSPSKLPSEVFEPSYRVLIPLTSCFFKEQQQLVIHCLTHGGERGIRTLEGR